MSKEILPPDDIEAVMRRAIALVGEYKAILVLGFVSGMVAARNMKPAYLSLVLHELKDPERMDFYILTWSHAIGAGMEQEQERATPQAPSDGIVTL